MNNENNTLTQAIDYIKKDAGINNAIDAMEQLSLLILLKISYEAATYGNEAHCNIESFDILFDREYSQNKQRAAPNLFAILKNLNEEKCYILNEMTILTPMTVDKIDAFLTLIPIKIRSEKIIRLVLKALNSLEVYDQLAYQYDLLIAYMIKSSGSSGAYHTPKPIVSAIVKVTKPQKNQTIYDPAMGTGRFFIESSKFSNRNLSQVKGNDLSSFACLMGSVNLILNGIGIDNVSIADSFLYEDNKQYDLILSGVPFGKPFDVSKYEYEYHNYFSSLEAMFLKHTMSKLAKDGKAALIVPDGLLFNQSKGLTNLRYELLTHFNLHTILSLPKGALAPYSGVKVSVVFFDNNLKRDDIWFYQLKAKDTKGKIQRLSDLDFSEFIEQFDKRKNSAQSCVFSKKKILEDKECALLLELPKKTPDEAPRSELAVLSELLESFKKSHDLIEEIQLSITKPKNSNLTNRVSLNDLFKTRAGKVLNKSNFSKAAPYPVYGGNGVVGYYEEFNRTGQNILIGRVGSYCGNVHFIDKPIWLTDNSFSVELIDESKVHMGYLAHVLRSLDLNKLARGTAQASISFDKIKHLEIDLPNYVQQVEICVRLDLLTKQASTMQSYLSCQTTLVEEIVKSSTISSVMK